jgi:hypothetical protein
MMTHVPMNDDALAISMFWAGALMVFAPLVFAGIVLAVWWHQRRHAPAAEGPRPESVADTPSATGAVGDDAAGPRDGDPR